MLPEIAELLGLSLEELFQVLATFGVSINIESFRRGARSIYERRRIAQAQGIQFFDEVTIQAELEQLIRETSHVVRDIERKAVHDQKLEDFTKDEIENDTGYIYKWQAVANAANSCPSCVARHGEEETLETWRMVGPPGSSSLICESKCRCELVRVGEREEG